MFGYGHAKKINNIQEEYYTHSIWDEKQNKYIISAKDTECIFCLQQITYIEENGEPLLLECGNCLNLHTYHEKCLSKYYKHKGSSQCVVCGSDKINIYKTIPVSKPDDQPLVIKKGDSIILRSKREFKLKDIVSIDLELFEEIKDTYMDVYDIDYDVLNNLENKFELIGHTFINDQSFWEVQSLDKITYIDGDDYVKLDSDITNDRIKLI